MRARWRGARVAGPWKASLGRWHLDRGWDMTGPWLKLFRARVINRGTALRKGRAGLAEGRKEAREARAEQGREAGPECAGHEVSRHREDGRWLSQGC